LFSSIFFFPKFIYKLSNLVGFFDGKSVKTNKTISPINVRRQLMPNIIKTIGDICTLNGSTGYDKEGIIPYANIIGMLDMRSKT
jgi:signal peptidase I